jgi:two-component system cell cycle response regulator
MNTLRRQGRSANLEQQENKPSVLVVNDVPDQLTMLQEVLRHAGFCVLSAADGDEGYKVAKLKHPDLVLSDVTMPVSGIQLCRLIRSDDELQTTPVLLASGLRKDDQSVLEGFAAGADDYLEMPINPLRLVAQAARLVERKKVEEALRDLSLTDELTMLRNRRGFITLCGQYLELVRSHRTKSGLVLAYADIDGLKHINDRFGHQEGSRAIVDAAEILKKSCRRSDIVGRIGGDEFTMLAVGTDGANEITCRIEENIRSHNAEGKRPYKLSLSLGVTRIEPGSTASIEELLAKADQAMYVHKNEKKSRLDSEESFTLSTRE